MIHRAMRSDSIFDPLNDQNNLIIQSVHLSRWLCTSVDYWLYLVTFAIDKFQLEKICNLVHKQKVAKSDKANHGWENTLCTFEVKAP